MNYVDYNIIICQTIQYNVHSTYKSLYEKLFYGAEIKINIYDEFEKDNEFTDDEKIYYIFTTKSGAAWLSKSNKYYTITCPLHQYMIRKAER